MTGSTPTEAQALPRQAERFRIFLNRIIFRGTIFIVGAIALFLYRVLGKKELAWRFAKTRARSLCRMCGVRVHVRGLEHLGAGPYMFTPNHQSNFDIAALLGFLPGNNRFGTKRELFNEPILGTVLRTMGMIPIDRDDPAGSIERLNLLKGEPFSVIIFPEGTRSLDGTLLPFKKGAFVAALKLQIPVVPVVCKRTSEIMPKGGYLSIVPGEVELVVLEPIPTVGLGYEDRDRLRDLVRERIEEELNR
jgi:1-acyl-sn-glycerol-3-phosphate acyltransferase